ncbi:MAG: leucine-rich repeat domain-containing protein, partial [Bacteroidetes bacterium]|nr:leucine-rich repeat domain-containing protein [Bacteroidota bacterium]
MLRILSLFICLLYGSVLCAQTADDEMFSEEQTFYSLEAALKNPLEVLKLDLRKQKLKTLPE